MSKLSKMPLEHILRLVLSSTLGLSREFSHADTLNFNSELTTFTCEQTLTFEKSRKTFKIVRHEKMIELLHAALYEKTSTSCTPLLLYKTSNDFTPLILLQ